MISSAGVDMSEERDFLHDLLNKLTIIDGQIKLLEKSMEKEELSKAKKKVLKLKSSSADIVDLTKSRMHNLKNRG